MAKRKGRRSTVDESAAGGSAGGATAQHTYSGAETGSDIGQSEGFTTNFKQVVDAFVEQVISLQKKASTKFDELTSVHNDCSRALMNAHVDLAKQLNSSYATHSANLNADALGKFQQHAENQRHLLNNLAEVDIKEGIGTKIMANPVVQSQIEQMVTASIAKVLGDMASAGGKGK